MTLVLPLEKGVNVKERVKILLVALILATPLVLKIWFNGFDGQGRILIALTTILFFWDLSLNRLMPFLISGKKGGLIWAISFIYVTINTLAQYSRTDVPMYSFIGLYLYCPFVLTVSLATITKKNWSYAIRVVGLSLFIILLLSLKSAVIEGGRLVSIFWDPNEHSLLVFSVIVFAILNFLERRRAKYLFIVQLALLMSLLILLASRMGFIIGLLSISCFYVFSRNNLGIFSVKRFFALLFVLGFFLAAVLDDTTLGSRLSDTADQSAQLEVNYAKGTIFEKFGDRGVYYVLGFKAFLDSPIIGIGLGNFLGKYYQQSLHSEIMIQLTELGFMGFLFFLLKHYYIIRQIKKSVSVSRSSENIFLYVILICILLSSSTLFLFKSLYVAAVYGVLLLKLNQNRKE